MKIAFAIHTPGQVHLWHYPIIMLKEKGHDIMVLTRKEESIIELLNAYNIPFNTYGKVGRTRTSKIMGLPGHSVKSFNIISRFKPNIIVGTGIIEAYSAFILRKPSIIFEDTEGTPFLERIQWETLTNVIITPDCLVKDFGAKQVRFSGYKELAYLHPQWFIPDPTIYDELKIKKDEKYVILRFNPFDAVHDVGRYGFRVEDQLRLVKELDHYAHVFISPEAPLPKELEKNRLLIPYHRIHQALYYADMFVSDTGTMVTEAAILGTPAIQCYSDAGRCGNLAELEHKYGMVYTFKEPDLAIAQAISLVKQTNLKEQWNKKRQILLRDKIDVTKFLVDFIENYPTSFPNYKQKSNY
jgi:hypothetical protein